MSPDAPAAGGYPAEVALARLRAAGHRITTARRVLVSVLSENRAHRSADELAAAVQACAPGTNRSTIYRNLDELARLGLIDRTGIGGRPAAYHLAPADHGHLACESCGQITEIPGQLLDSLARTLRDRYGFTLSQHRFAITGRCAGCH
jgi:Fur family transcriptional regulator, ferric uptake regulator